MVFLPPSSRWAERVVNEGDTAYWDGSEERKSYIEPDKGQVSERMSEGEGERGRERENEREGEGRERQREKEKERER